MVNKVETDHLLNLYNNWLRDPKTYGAEMATTVDKIINKVLFSQSLRPYYYKIEDMDDLIQDLRFLCFRRLKNIQNPTNKRLYNYLRISVSFELKDRARKVGKLMDRDRDSKLEPSIIFQPSFFHFGNETLNQVATLLSQEYSQKDIILQMGISQEELDNSINQLKEIFNEEKYI